MLAYWEQLEEFETTEQRLVDQARKIRVNGWISELEMEEIQKQNIEEPITTSREAHSQSAESTSHDVSEDVWAIPKGVIPEEELHVVTVRRIQGIARNPERQRIPTLKTIPRHTLLKEVKEVPAILDKIPTRNATQSNDLLYL